MPQLPKELQEKFIGEYHLSAYDAHVLTDEREIALYFLELIQFTKNYKSAANWVINEVKSFVNENNISISAFKVKPAQLAEIIQLIDDIEQKIFKQFDDSTWFYPGHGNDSTLGAERPHISEWRARGW